MGVMQRRIHLIIVRIASACDLARPRREVCRHETVRPPVSSDSMKRSALRTYPLEGPVSSPRRRWLVPVLPLACAAILTALGLWSLSPPGDVQAAEPKATAGFQTTEELVLAVELPALDKGSRPELTLELLDRNNEVIEKKTPKLPGNEAASLRVAFARPNEKL